MSTFIQRIGQQVIGRLDGFDRLRFRGTKRLLCNPGGLFSLLWKLQVLMKDFVGWSKDVTCKLRQATVQVAKDGGRPLEYLALGSINKEQRAAEIAARDGVREGLVCIFSALEPCWTYGVNKNRRTSRLDLAKGPGRCLHYYHYHLHPQLGLVHIRVQTWLPLTMHICINGRHWLCRQLDRQGIGYKRRENCLVDVEDVAAAQGLLDAQLRADWPSLLEGLKELANPIDRQLLGGHAVDYYWSLEQSEWASDLIFRDAAVLGRWYPRLVLHGLTALNCRDAMRFLGRKLPIEGTGRFAGEVVNDVRHRPEGVRIKHRVGGNSIKMYDKQGSVLRVETTINDPGGFKVYRPSEGDEQGGKKWMPMRKGVADLAARAGCSQAANDRYLQSLATVEDTASLGELMEPLCRRTRWKGRPVRGLKPMSQDDNQLLKAVASGEFALHGFHNRDIRRQLYGEDTAAGNGSKADPATKRRRSAAVTRKLRMLRAHHLIEKLPHTQRYRLTEAGRTAIHALLTACQCDLKRMTA